MADTVVVDLEVKGIDEPLEAADALAKLNEQVIKDQQELGNLAAAMRKLKSSDEEVTAEAKKLGDQFGAVRKRLAQNSLEYIKQGGALDQLGRAKKAAAETDKKATDESKKEGEEKKKVTEAAKKDGKEVEVANKRMKASGLIAQAKTAILKKLKLETKENEDGTKRLSGGWALAGRAAIGATAAFAALAVGAAASAAAVYAMGVSSADSTRTTHIMFAAWGRGAQQGEALYSHVDKLAKTAPVAREQIEQMALGYQQAGFQGKGLTETLRATTRALGTLGEGAAKKIEGLAERARVSKRFFANALDFQGTGLTLDEVASQLGKNLNISMASAKAAIQNGRVKLDDGMKALADSMEKRVAPFEKDLFISLPNTAKRAKESLKDLFSGLPIDGVLNLLSEMVSLLDKNSATGKALRAILSSVFGPLDKAAKDATPGVIEAIKRMIIIALRFGTTILNVKNSLEDTFGSNDNKNKISMLETALYALGGAAAAVGIAVAIGLAPFVWFFKQVNDVVNGISEAYDRLKDLDWKAIGTDLIDGFVDGIKAGIEKVRSAVTSVGDVARDALKDALKSRSPSKVTHDIGGDYDDGFIGGTKAKMGGVKRAAAAVGEEASKATRAAITFSDMRPGSKGGGSNSPPPPHAAPPAAPPIQIVFSERSIVIEGSKLSQQELQAAVTQGLRGLLQSKGVM